MRILFIFSFPFYQVQMILKCRISFFFKLHDICFFFFFFTKTLLFENIIFFNRNEL